MKTACVQDIYQCDTCKSALGRKRKELQARDVIPPASFNEGNFKKCMNYEFDAEKVKLQLQRKNKWIEYSDNNSE